MFERVSKPMQKDSLKSFLLMAALKHFARFTGKYMYQSLFLHKVSVQGTSTLLKKRLWSRCFPVNFAKLLSAPYFKHRRWLVLPMVDLPIASPTDNSLLLLAGCIFLNHDCISWHSKNFS